LNHYQNLECYIPDRYQEGYGISTKGIDVAKSNGVSLIVALDCGIKSIDKIQYAKSLGIDFIICDHHLPGETIPDAVAVLDPKRTDCQYPYKELSGCGVGFKLMQALTQHEGWPVENLYDFLDLVAVSIGSDIVPITGENRILMHFGLEKVNQKPSPGIEALLQIAGFKPKENGHYSLKVDRLVFGIGPRINAAGRIGHGLGAVQLLISENLEEALGNAHLAIAVARIAGDRSVALGRTTPLAGFAFDQARDIDLDRMTEHRLVQVQFHFIAKVRAAEHL
jgi:single-stranded-DNA-specific exonuclease